MKPKEWRKSVRQLLPVLTSILLVCLTACVSTNDKEVAKTATAAPVPRSTSDVTVVADVPTVIPEKNLGAGVNVLFYGNDPGFNEKLPSLLDRMENLGATSLALVFPFKQSDEFACDVAAYADTLSDDNIRTFVKEAHERHMAVMIRPLMDESSLKNKSAAEWRGTIRPRDINCWFANYKLLTMHYAGLAAETNAEILSIGVEFNSLVGNDYYAYWRDLITSVRSVYSGKLIYSHNQDKSLTVSFWDDVDIIGIGSFFELDVPKFATQQELVAAWKQHVSYLENLAATYKKPVMLTEVGVRSEVGAFRVPHVWNHETGIDLIAQKAYYQATCEATMPVVSGYYFWHVGLYLPKDANNPEFDFTGKPSEAAVQSCFQKQKEKK